MSSPTTFRFPDAATMTKYLSNHKALKVAYYEEKGITQAISELAAERFADRQAEDLGVKIGTMLLISDLQRGKDGFTEKPLPNLGNLGLDPSFWVLISELTEIALKDCAKSVKV